MIPLLISGKTFGSLGGIPNAISCTKTVNAENHSNEITLVVPVQENQNGKITYLNIVCINEGKQINASRKDGLEWYVIYRIVQSGHLLTVYAMEFVTFLMRNTVVQGYTFKDDGNASTPYIYTFYDVVTNSFPARNADSGSLITWDVDGSPYAITYTVLSTPKQLTLEEAIHGRDGSIADLTKKQLYTSLNNINGAYKCRLEMADLVVNRNTNLTYGAEIKAYTYDVDASGIVSDVVPSIEEDYEEGSSTIKGFRKGNTASNSTGEVRTRFFSRLVAPYDVTQFYTDSRNRPSASKMQHRALSYLDAHCVPREHIDITIGKLTAEIQLHEIVNIWIPGRTTAIQAKVTEYEYDVLKERYTRVSVGEPRKSFARSVGKDISGKIADATTS